MSDLGGSHGWLLDVGGGVPRAMRPGRTPQRPSDDELARLVGAPVSRRTGIAPSVERFWVDDGVLILKLGGFWHGRAEPLLYELVLRPEPHGAPRLVAADQQRGWIVLEEIGDGRPVRLDDADALRRVYERLAAVHAAHADLAGLPAGLEPVLGAAPLSAPEPDAYARGVARLAELVGRAAEDGEVWELDGGSAERAGDLAVWAETGGPALAGSGPATLLHGDFQRGNWVLDGPTARVLDWELAAIGPGLLDLCYLAPDGPGAGHAPAGELAWVAVEAYCRRLAELGAPGPTRAAARAHLRDAIVWGAIAGAVARLEEYYATQPRSRAPRDALPGEAADLLALAHRTLGGG